MAIYHLQTKPFGRASGTGGRSCVAAAAYRAGERLVDERYGVTHDYTRRHGIEHTGIVLPTGVDAPWALDRAGLWNAAEKAEARKDARVAREVEVALPHELSADQRLAAVRDLARELADRYGAAVDFAIHSPHGKMTATNHHAHLLMTTRLVGPTGMTDKTEIERENKWLLSRNLPTSFLQVRDVRQTWERIANAHLQAAGQLVRIDHRSHKDRGLEILPNRHVGVHATQLVRQGAVGIERERIGRDASRHNADVIADAPEQILTLITGEKSVFDAHDIARALHRAMDQDHLSHEVFSTAMARVMASPELVQLAPEAGSRLARFTTRDMQAVEAGMIASATKMAAGQGHRVAVDRVREAMIVQDAVLDARRPGSRLSDEQRAAVMHIAQPSQIAAVIGLAGAGKSTMLAAARVAWEAEGYTVHGAALSGKAADGLEGSSGIASRTLASLEWEWDKTGNPLGPRDVLVIDEAGMVSSRQMARFVAEAARVGAKLVLVGDPGQLQAIGAGSPFRAIVERVGSVELTDIRRQAEPWQREASRAFGTQQTGAGLAAYAERGAIAFTPSRDEARALAVAVYVADRAAHPNSSQVALAHQRVDVRGLNDDIRDALQTTGALAKGPQAGERTFATNDGPRAFAPGDRLVFLENNRDLDVKNGMLGTVQSVTEREIAVTLDGSDRVAIIATATYTKFDHGYATTIHKSQGDTVDRVYVLASPSMDQNLTYVALTRHTQAVTLYAGRDDFKDMAALTTALSRDGSKETTLDYAKADVATIEQLAGLARARAALAALWERCVKAKDAVQAKLTPVVVKVVPVLAPNPGAGKAIIAPAHTVSEPSPGPANAPPRGDATARPALAPAASVMAAALMAQRTLLQALDSYVKVQAANEAMTERGLPIQPHQKAALQKAETALEAVRPGSVKDLASARANDAPTRAAMAQPPGSDRATELLSRLDNERIVQSDITLKTARLAEAWNASVTQRNAAIKSGDTKEFETIKVTQRAVALAIGGTPEVVAELRANSTAYGVSPAGSLGQALIQPDVGKALARAIDPPPAQRIERGGPSR